VTTQKTGEKRKTKGQHRKPQHKAFTAKMLREGCEQVRSCVYFQYMNKKTTLIQWLFGCIFKHAGY